MNMLDANFGTSPNRITLWLRTASVVIGLFTFVHGIANAQECELKNLNEEGRTTATAQANFTCISAKLTAALSRIEALESELVPFRSAEGIVAAFDRSQQDACPRGWSIFKEGGGRVIVGAGTNTNTDQNGSDLTDHAALRDDPVKSVGGEEQHTLTEKEIPEHSHSTVQMIADNGIDGVDSTTTASGDHHNEPRDTGKAGGGEAHNNMPPYVALFYCKMD